MKFIDTHAHLNFKDYDKDRDDVIKTAFKNGVKYIINIGTDLKTSQESILLSQKYDKIFAAVGWHPHDAKTFEENELLKMLEFKKVVAVGEIGLDYYRNLSPKNIQKAVFEQQIQIAINKKLPIIVHDRNAHNDVLSILKKYQPEKVVFHCFSGDYIFAQEIIENGWFISFTGNITYKRGEYYSIIKDIPQDRFFVETDAPFLTPKPFRGKRNRSEYVRYIIETIAEIKQQTPNEIAEITTQNSEKFFSITKKLD
ncbi:MAG: TatD family hydrolase [Candidatus Cloacimonetes bacterium]|nr:TatD family hydrolase [Candidatus Cloacimonadota bacterium]